MRWLQLRFEFDSTAVRRAFDCLSKVISDRNSLVAVTLTYLFIEAAVLQPTTGRPTVVTLVVEWL